MSPGRPGERLVADYLADLDRELKGMSEPERRRTLERVGARIIGADLDMADGAAVRMLLKHIGSPKEIAAEVKASRGSKKPGSADALCPWLLLLGGFVFIIGWFMGVGLLWASPTWPTRDKLLGTLIWPGGLAALVVLGSFLETTTKCGGAAATGKQVGPHCAVTSLALPPAAVLPLVAVLVVAPVLVAIHLELVRRRA
jgi:hypothetical protein